MHRDIKLIIADNPNLTIHDIQKALEVKGHKIAITLDTVLSLKQAISIYEWLSKNAVQKRKEESSDRNQKKNITSAEIKAQIRKQKKQEKREQEEKRKKEERRKRRKERRDLSKIGQILEPISLGPLNFKDADEVKQWLYKHANVDTRILGRTTKRIRDFYLRSVYVKTLREIVLKKEISKIVNSGPNKALLKERELIRKRQSENGKKNFVRIISTPMGGQNKRR